MRIFTFNKLDFLLFSARLYFPLKMAFFEIS